MTTIAKTARAALAVAVLALVSAGAASADAFHPDPFVSTGRPGRRVTARPRTSNPGRRSGRGTTPARPPAGLEPHLARPPNVGGCYPRCVI